MGKEVKKPQEDLAPAYFVQYSALWCILLGFFVMLLSLGSTQMGPGTDGMGEVRDAFGSTGGIGLLPYAKNALFGRSNGNASSFRIRKSAPVKVVSVDGYIRGMLWKKGLSDVSMITVVHTPSGEKVVLQVPLNFRSDEQLAQDSVTLLEILGSVLVDLKQYELEVMSIGESGATQESRQRQGMLRSAVVARLLLESASLLPERVQAVGYADNRIITMYGIQPVSGHILISIQQGIL